MFCLEAALDVKALTQQRKGRQGKSGAVYNGSSLAYVEHFPSSPFHTDHPVMVATGTDLLQKKCTHVSALEDSPWLLDFEGAIL